MMTVGDTLVYEHQVRQVILDSEVKLRQEGLDQVDDAKREEAQHALGQWPRFLELTLLFASVNEACTRLGLQTNNDINRELPQLDRLVRMLSRLDPLAVFQENKNLFVPPIAPPPDAPIVRDIAVVLRTCQSVLLHCPIGALEAAGQRYGLQVAANRCRVAFDALTAFVARNAYPQQSAIFAAGSAYADGRLSIDEVASMLAMTVPDAVALLEQLGFCRTPERLGLSPEQRAARLRAIRQDREAHGGAPRNDPGLVARDVIASQRIEDVDARPWLHP